MGAQAALPITVDEARQLAVIAQRLDRRPPPVRSPAAVKHRLLEFVRHLGCVQIDTISVISRTHETVLWSRLGPYDPALFAALIYPDGLLTEYWAHAAAFVPVETLPHYRGAMEWYQAKYEGEESWPAREQALVAAVLGRIAAEGPLGSRHFERPPGPRPEPWAWWGGKPARQALDHLWTRGDLMIQQRINFQRVYELTERIAPQMRSPLAPTEAEDRRFFVSAALNAIGIAAPDWIADYFRSWGRRNVTPGAAAAELATLEAAGVAVRVAVPGWKRDVWLATALLPRLEALRAGRGRPTLTTLLSPFDNLIWYRPRTSQLFGFDYRIECYTPEPKRKYGYYTLPILHRGRLVGRVDPSYDRKRRVLTLKAVHLEPGVRPTPSLASAVAGAARDLTAFLGGGPVLVSKSYPADFAEMLREAVGTDSVSAFKPSGRITVNR